MTYAAGKAALVLPSCRHQPPLPLTSAPSAAPSVTPLQFPWAKVSLGFAAAGLMTVAEPPSAGCTATVATDAKVGSGRRRLQCMGP